MRNTTARYRRFRPSIKMVVITLLLVSVGTSAALAPLRLERDASVPEKPPEPAAVETWAAVAPGRVESRTGEIAIRAEMSGRLLTLAAVGADVAAGDVLASFDDRESASKLLAAEADAAFRLAEHNRDVSGGLQSEQRAAVDTVVRIKSELSAAQNAKDTAREATLKAELADAEKALATMSAIAGVAAPSRSEAALALAKAEVTAAQVALERTVVKAPAAGTVVRVSKRVGEFVSGNGDDLLAVADLKHLQVRGELDERDMAQVSVGQRVALRSDTFPDLSFEGHVTRIGLTESARKVAPRAAQASADNILEVIIDIDQEGPLVPGMRVDAYFARVAMVNNGGKS